jgi:mannose-1-phosphate guanylyltransferase
VGMEKFYPVILAGGSGTRFWPRSRRRSAKQVLALDGARTMIQNTVTRLLPVCGEKDFWVITNEFCSDEIQRQLPQLPGRQIVIEPVARNTAPAIGLAAFLLERLDPGAIIGMFPADHVIADEGKFLEVLKSAAEIAAGAGNIAVMGVKPSHPETGYGYIETGKSKDDGVLHVRRFTEKPGLAKAQEFVAAGNYYWNSGMFVWSARTLVNALREHLPQTAPYLEEIAAAWGGDGFQEKFNELYPRCENISIDYAVLEPRSGQGERASNLFCLPADFGWNDLGSWTALYGHRTASDPAHPNVVEARDSCVLDASGNYIYAPGKFVAAIGVDDLVIVETEDALLVTTRKHSQDVGKIVQYLHDKKMTDLV